MQMTKVELEYSQKELDAKCLEEAKEVEMAEKLKLEDGILTKQLEVQHIADELQHKDEKTRRPQPSLLFNFEKKCHSWCCSFQQTAHSSVSVELPLPF